MLPALLAVASVMAGAEDLSPAQVWHGLFQDTGSYGDAVVGERLSRTVLGLPAGSALGLAGGVLQALTRNPPADPGLPGVNAGASAAVVTAITLLGVTSPGGRVWFAFLGAAAVGAPVWFPGGGRVIRSLPARQVARTPGLLPQSSLAPDGITVASLVARGRYPHQGLLRRWSAEDERVVREAMDRTRAGELADRHVGELSGGRRQRVGTAMAHAQQIPLLLPDEPSACLDIQHRIDVLDLCAELHEERGRTPVAVLHDLHHAARYATHLIALRDGRAVAPGAPRDIVTAALVEEVFGPRCQVIDDPETGTPLVVPAARGARLAGGAAAAGAAATGAS
ncbi:iron chelate uptake ABC transporter family permease subunit [Streptomyces sp. AD55]|uniref:iron chelate uptake ABC transporter family permease subunit n=1 Tax=Streptomyces sp. AD55 TaxID=3242895 RepID=UPI0035293F7F